jgi:Fe-S cluster biogenesis protein NfuA
MLDRQELDERLAVLSRVLRAHAGGVELVHADDEGLVKLRYTGMCTGCPLRPLTTERTVRPVLGDLTGLTRLEVLGSRISVEAVQRLATYVGGAEASIAQR